MKCIFFVLSVRNIENPDSGGPREYWNPSSTIDVCFALMLRKLVAIFVLLLTYYHSDVYLSSAIHEFEMWGVQLEQTMFLPSLEH